MMGYGGMGFGWMWMLLLPLGTIALAVWLVRWMFPQGEGREGLEPQQDSTGRDEVSRD